VRVTLVDRTNHHLFQPLLYQVATAGLSPAEIAAPIRGVLSRQANCTVLLDEVLHVHLDARVVRLREAGELEYDYLILALGATNNYFGHDEWSQFAPGLKSLDDALEIRRRILLAFEAAEREKDPAKRQRLLTFVSIGGGPTGVEMAGSISELSRFALAKDFRSIEPGSTRVVLVEAGPRILSAFPEELSAKAVSQLHELGVDVRTGGRVTQIDEDGVHIDGTLLPSATIVWAAGVRGTPLAKQLGVELDRAGRVKVQPDCSLPGHAEAFAIGDMAALTDVNGVNVPGLSPAAMQEARHVARMIVRSMRGESREPFAYRDKGSMATIGRSRAIAQTKRTKLSGLLAWLAWLVVHLWYLIGFRNRFVVVFSWAWSYFTYGRGARLITGSSLAAGAPFELEDDASHPRSEAIREHEKAVG
jgi:NADH dehydrogenase